MPLGNGVLLWFEIADLDAAAERARVRDAEIVRDVHVNPNAKQRDASAASAKPGWPPVAPGHSTQSRSMPASLSDIRDGS